MRLERFCQFGLLSVLTERETLVDRGDSVVEFSRLGSRGGQGIQHLGHPVAGRR